MVVNLVNVSESRITRLGVSDLALETFNCTGETRMCAAARSGSGAVD